MNTIEIWSWVNKLKLSQKEIISAEDLAKLLENFHLSSLDGLYEAFIPNIMWNLQKTNNIILKNWKNLTKEELLIFKNLNNINKKAKETTKSILTDMLKEFLPKSFKINKFINSLWNLWFVNKKTYEEFINTGKEWNKIWFEIYVLVANYIISYYLYLAKIEKYFSNIIDNNFLSVEIQNKIYELMQRNNYNISYEEEIHLRILLFIIATEIENIDNSWLVKEVFNNLNKFRIKIPESAFKKILKSKKYQDQYKNLGILPDQIWFLALFNDKGTLKLIAETLKNSNKIWKFNDRWILAKQHTNKDTLDNVLPFVNTEFIWNIDWKELPLGELSLRINPDSEIKEILNTTNKSLYKKIYKLVNKIDYLNHDIYKLSQDIKILRFFIDKNIISWITNLDKAVKEYLNRKIKEIKNKLFKQLEELFKENDIEYNENLLLGYIEFVINKVLVEKLNRVIIDIAWEYILDDIKSTSWYKKQKDWEKRKKLKILSKKFIKKLQNPSSDSLSVYTDKEIINEIYDKFKRKYKQVLSEARFFKQVIKNLRTFDEMLNEKRKKSDSLYNLLSKW
jgi:hypothetical protein